MYIQRWTELLHWKDSSLKDEVWGNYQRNNRQFSIYLSTYISHEVVEDIVNAKKRWIYTIPWHKDCLVPWHKVSSSTRGFCKTGFAIKGNDNEQNLSIIFYPMTAFVIWMIIGREEWSQR